MCIKVVQTCREFTLPDKVVMECHSIQQIGLAIGRMVEDRVKSERTDRWKIDGHDGRDGDWDCWHMHAD